MNIARLWRVEHPSWSVVYRAPWALGRRPDAARIEVGGMAVAYMKRGGMWMYAEGECAGVQCSLEDQLALAQVRIAVWPRNRAPFVDCSLSERGGV